MRAIITSLLTLYIIAISEAQEYDFENPIKLGIAVNSESEESSVFLSSNGNRLYFSRIGHTKNSGGISGGQDIWYCDKKEEEWHEASNVLTNINNKGDNAIIGISIDEDTVYLLNNYKGKNTTIGVSYSVKEEAGWSVPKSLNIPGILSNKGYYGFNMHPNGQILIISMNLNNSIGKEDLYVSLNDGDNMWSALIHLGEVINSKGFEITPFIANDGRKMYFSSEGHGGFGNADIFVSTRIDESWTNWTEPVNLGEKINSIGFDASFSIWRDSLVYFCSNRSGIMSDVFQSKLLKPLEHTEEFQEIVNLANNTLADLSELLGEGTRHEDNNEHMIAENKASISNEEVLLNQIQAIPDLASIIEATDKIIATTTHASLNESIIENSTSVHESVETEIKEVVESYEEEETLSDAEIEVELEINLEDQIVEPEKVAEIKSIFIGNGLDEDQGTMEDQFVLKETLEINEEINPEDDKEIPIAAEESGVAYSAENEQMENGGPDQAGVVKSGTVTDEFAFVETKLAADKNRLEEESVLDKAGHIYRTSLDQVYFNHNSSYLNDDGRKMLDKLLVKLNEQNNLKLEVLAFADNLGEDHYNMWISERRANRVIEYIVSKGIDPNRLNGKWFGEHKPSEECAECTEMQHQKNRRVELIID